jgi:hypothetical protein
MEAACLAHIAGWMGRRWLSAHDKTLDYASEGAESPAYWFRLAHLWLPIALTAGLGLGAIGFWIPGAASERTGSLSPTISAEPRPAVVNEVERRF